MSGKLSWIVAIVLILGFVGFLCIRLFRPVADSPTPATTKPGALAPIGTEMPITDIVRMNIKNDDSAGGSYADAVEY